MLGLNGVRASLLVFISLITFYNGVTTPLMVSKNVEIEKLEEDNENKNLIIINLKEEKEYNENWIDQLESRLDYYLKKEPELKTKIENLKKEIEELKEELDGTKDMYNANEDLIEDMKKEIKELEDTKNSQTQALNNGSKRIGNLLAKVSKLKKQLKTTKDNRDSYKILANKCLSKNK